MMEFRSKVLAAAAVIAAVTTIPASAATLVAATGTPLSETIHNIHGVDSDGFSLTLESDPSAYLVDYSSSSILHYNGNSGGFAQVTGTGPGSGFGFADLTIAPEDVDFSALKFNLDLPAAGSFEPPNGYQTDFTFDTTVFFAGGGSQIFNTDAVTGTGENRYLLSAATGETISMVTFSDLVGVSTAAGEQTVTNSYNFDAIRQVSFNPAGGTSGGTPGGPPGGTPGGPPGGTPGGTPGAVPEPATWAMLLFGFGMIGSAMRARRKSGAALIA